jgi:hypothetical protein
MKRIFFFSNVIMGFIAIIFFSSCSKEVSFPNTPPATASSSSTTEVPQTAMYVNADNWVKFSGGNYRCTFYGLKGYGNEFSGSVQVYLVNQNVEKIISNGPILCWQ